MIINYHGKKYEIATEVEDGEEELDLFINDNEDLEKTIEFPNEFLENTLDLKNVVDLVGESHD